MALPVRWAVVAPLTYYVLIMMMKKVSNDLYFQFSISITL